MRDLAFDHIHVYIGRRPIVAEPLNRDRLRNDDGMGLFLEKLMAAPEVKPLLSDESLRRSSQRWRRHEQPAAQRCAQKGTTKAIKTGK